MYALIFLYNHYLFLRRKDIDKVFKIICGRNLLTTCLRLDGMPKAFKTPRKVTSEDVIPDNIPLLQQIAYFKHKKAIRRALKQYDENYRLARK